MKYLRKLKGRPRAAFDWRAATQNAILDTVEGVFDALHAMERADENVYHCYELDYLAWCRETRERQRDLVKRYSGFIDNYIYPTTIRFCGKVWEEELCGEQQSYYGNFY